MKNYYSVFVFLFLSLFVHGQVKEFDMLEMKYNQGHYRMVFRKANRLIDNPEFDFSFLPRYYKTLASLHLAQNERWLRRNPHVFIDAKSFFKEMNSTYEGRSVLRAHAYEMSAMKTDLMQWAGELQIIGDRRNFAAVEDLLNTVFKDVDYVIDFREDELVKKETPDKKEKVEVALDRKQLIEAAKQHLGVPYRWAGDSPKGFDCSGYTSYVVQSQFDRKLQRRAADQYKELKRVKAKNVKPGDFVFFDSGSGISHVGIIISTENNTMKMIHASTSIGISIVDVNTSSYWKGRLAGFATIFQD